jgi:N utilization substance protein A
MPQETSKNRAPSNAASSHREGDPGAESARQDSDIAADLHRFDASIDEEIDALEVDLEQDGDEFRDPDEGTGLIDDELAQERVEEMTEVGPDLDDKGVVTAVPGRENTSEKLRRHYRNTGAAKADEVTEDTVDEPRDEAFSKRTGKKGTAS